jgi:hypothetical protein
MVASHRTGDRICLYPGNSDRTGYSSELWILEFGLELETFEVFLPRTEVRAGIPAAVEILVLAERWSCKIPYLEAGIASLGNQCCIAAGAERALEQCSVGQLAPVVQPFL